MAAGAAQLLASRRQFIVLLQQACVARTPLKIVSPFPLLDDYQSWLRIHRGLSERIIGRHRRDLHRLLPALDSATQDYDAALGRKVVSEWRDRTGPANMRTIKSALRSYLRFLAGAGLCSPTSIAPSRPSCNDAFRRCRGILPPLMLNSSIHPAINSTKGA